MPIVTSDFVYAAAAEEFGILLCALLLLLYACLVWRGWRVASQARTPFGALLAVVGFLGAISDGGAGGRGRR